MGFLIGSETVSSFYNTGEFIFGSKFIAVASGVPGIFNFYSGGLGFIRYALYTDNSDAPNSLITGVTESTSVTVGWNSLPFISEGFITNGNNYWLCAWCSSDNIIGYSAVGAISYVQRNTTNVGYLWPSTADASWIVSTGRRYSYNIYSASNSKSFFIAGAGLN